METRTLTSKLNITVEELHIDVKNLLANATLAGYDSTNSFLKPRSIPVPRPIGGTFIDPDSVYKYGQRSIHAEGQGDGTITQERRGNADQYDFLHLDWKFRYTPPVSAIYNFNIPIIAACPYHLIADGACDNKEASCRIHVQSYIYQNLAARAFIPPNNHLSYVEVDGPNSDLFTDHDDNINKFDTCVAANNIDINGVFLFGNIPVEITVYITCEVMGKGAGSIADMNFTQGIGAVICPGLSVKLAKR